MKERKSGCIVEGEVNINILVEWLDPCHHEDGVAGPNQSECWDSKHSFNAKNTPTGKQENCISAVVTDFCENNALNGISMVSGPFILTTTEIAHVHAARPLCRPTEAS